MCPAADMREVKHLLDLPGAESKLSLWKAELTEEGSFDEAIKGCTGVFHLATPVDFKSKDPEVHSSIHSYLGFLAHLSTSQFISICTPN